MTNVVNIYLTTKYFLAISELFMAAVLTILKLVQLALFIALVGAVFGGAYFFAAQPAYFAFGLLALIGNHFLIKHLRS